VFRVGVRRVHAHVDLAEAPAVVEFFLNPLDQRAQQRAEALGLVVGVDRVALALVPHQPGDTRVVAFFEQLLDGLGRVVERAVGQRVGVAVVVGPPAVKQARARLFALDDRHRHV